MALTLKLLSGQQELFKAPKHSRTDICVYQGGYGSGKTWAGSLLGIYLAQKYPGSVGMACAKTYPLLRDTTLKTYHEHLDAMGFRYGIDYTFKSSESLFRFHCFGGSEVFFRHLETPEKVKSLNLGWIHVEEMSQIDEATFLMLLSRLRLKGVDQYRLFGTTNPQENKGWIYQYFVANQKKDADGITYRRIIAPSTQNRHLDPSYIQNMQNQYDDEYYRINVLGEDGDYTQGLVCRTWADINVEPVSYNEDAPLYISCDFNIDPNSWVVAHVWGSEEAKREFHFLDEITLEGATSRDNAEEFYARYGNHRGPVYVTGDASGANRSTQNNNANANNYTIIRDRLRALGMRSVTLDLPAANPAVVERIQGWNAAVCNTLGVRRVKVHPRCKWLIYNCENLRYKPGSDKIYEPSTKQIEQNGKLKHTKHVWDAASYLVDRYSPARKLDAVRTGPKVVASRLRPKALT